MMKRILFFLGDPANTGRLKKLLYITLAVIVASDFIVHREHAVFIWDKIPGWSAIYGFISCVLLIFVSKFIGHIWLMKDEDYYD
ncbi:MAG: hypothetical protein A2X87_04085 [Deltaproteobacteria bacterium GWC2_42_51]|nr:MAG: hypothetical protein A2056_01040 [Deltaproteobacteria bacterium GWA2_42_85]OGP28511.1 MAG: hypothetical protein A2067_09235 [Deltaproteobacteria bacterium GWB2_42_7]OGP36835.1 MAG: hypothetical protein A2X87_04085 [Deltaproteobacteria bacterium GWC2_42_51]OGP38142.1 MAG: hypothetical protein A2090_11575 [Deltaproteobacteria bacterium GWD2_42_10]OGP48239.1 MAG: hypothetical protein A2022_03450 [Deltaproteobacteria bacterium GWF2_42_12]OGQ26836.1 MAG: hypothetical protein A3D29_07095 [De